MKISLKNVGKVKAADVEIDGMTVIAGENDTGKSTVGKALYCAFNGLHDPENMIEIERMASVQNILYKLMPIGRGRYTDKTFGDLMELVHDVAHDIIRDREHYLNDRAALTSRISAISNDFEGISEEEVKKHVEHVHELLSVDDDTVLRTHVGRLFNNVFKGKVRNISTGEDAVIRLNIRGAETSVVFQDSKISQITDARGLLTEVIYIDDPFVLDYIGNPGVFHPDYKEALMEKLVAENDGDVITSVVTSEKIAGIVGMMDQACKGKLVIQSAKPVYSFGDGRELPVQSVSMGMKSFIILKSLLLNGSIEERGAVILDEPEIHLHPAWQVLFAEILVMLQKAFNLHILINTHSPYFLRAIEVYSVKHGIEGKCHYYLAENVDGFSVIRDVSENREPIYDKLTDPFQVLEDEYAELDGNF